MAGAAAGALWLDPPPEEDWEYDPLATARARGSRADNAEAVIPPQCYASTAGGSNICWTCHTDSHGDNRAQDVDLQREYAFSDFALTNRWEHLFVDFEREAAEVAEAEIARYVRGDNYRALQRALSRSGERAGSGASRVGRTFVPDLDLAQGFDAEGFARDGSGWRAYRYRPFPGIGWLTNGSAGDAFVRLPPAL